MIKCFCMLPIHSCDLICVEDTMIFKDRWEVIKNRHDIFCVEQGSLRNNQLNPPFSVIYFKGEVL